MRRFKTHYPSAATPKSCARACQCRECGTRFPAHEALCLRTLLGLSLDGLTY